MLCSNKQVAIIGAGPVGLAIAILLRRQQVDVTVYERDKDPHARIWGGTLDLHETSGQQALKEAGLLQQYFDMARPMGRVITDEQGTVILSVPPRTDTPEINRNDLRTILLGVTGPAVAWDRRLTALQPQKARWLLQFDNGTVATADVVIGANGGMSGIRKYVTGATAEYTGTYIIQGEVLQPRLQCPSIYRLCNNNILMTAHNGINLVANPDNNGALTYNISFAAPAEWMQETPLDFRDTQGIAALLANKCAHWHQAYMQLFHATTSYVGLPARAISLHSPWKKDRPLPVTLIGDAAHVMPPFAGQGANIGLLDALILSANLIGGKFETIEAAISDYEQQMFVYAKEAQQETSRNERAMHTPGFSFTRRFQQ